MQAGLAHRKLSFRDVFAMRLILFLWGLVVNWARSSQLWWRGGELRWSRRLELGGNRGLGGGIEIQQHLMRQAPVVGTPSYAQAPKTRRHGGQSRPTTANRDPISAQSRPQGLSPRSGELT